MVSYKIEMNVNHYTIHLNVFGYNEDTREIIGPIFQSEVKKPLYINMMFLEDGGNGHYM